MKKREKQLKKKTRCCGGRRTLERVEKVKSKLKTPKATKKCYGKK